MNVVVAIPFYKEAEKLEKCIAYLKESEVDAKLSFQVHDDSFEGNGFTYSVNRLIRDNILGQNSSDVKYFVIVNQDCYVKPDTLHVLVSFMEDHPDCGMAGVKQLSTEDPDRIIHGGTKDCFPAGIHEVGYVSKGDCNVTKKVPWVNGACMIVRTETILDIGVMDKGFKMFGSDSDWSYTARARGWDCWYVAQAVVDHEQGISRGTDPKMQKYMMLDMLYFRSKWLDGDLYRELVMERV